MAKKRTVHVLRKLVTSNDTTLSGALYIQIQDCADISGSVVLRNLMHQHYVTLMVSLLT